MPILLSDTYRHARVDHSVGWRVVGPGEVQVKVLCQAVSAMAATLESEALFRRYFSALLWGLSRAEEKIKNAAAALVEDANRFRAVVLAMLKETKANVKHRNGYVVVVPLRGVRSRTTDAIVAFNKVADILAEHIFERNPSRCSAAVKRPGKDRGAFRYFTLGRDEDAAPRYDDPRAWDRWRAALLEVGGSPAEVLLGDVARYAGKRFFQAAELQLYDIFVSPTDELQLKFGEKGNRHVHREIGYLPEAQYDGLIEYIAGPRARLTGWTLERIMQVASDPRRVDELKVPVLTEDGKNPLEYKKIYRVYRRAAERAGLYFRDEEFQRSGRRRYITFHYLRHEYVHRRLDAIVDLPRREYHREVRALIAYMNWSSGERMLGWYSRHHVTKLAQASAKKYNAQLDRQLDAASLRPSSPVPFSQGRETDVFLEDML